MNSGKHFCIIGTPVGHSRSPELYRAIFDEKGLYDHTYVINEITTLAGLDEFFSDMRAGRWDGCNVTMPWKTEAARRMDILLPCAELTDAVNTVVFRDGRLTGDSTDGGGMVNAIEQETGEKAENKKVVMLGCGGAARPIIAELGLRGAGKVTIFCRPGTNRELTDKMLQKCRSATEFIFADYEDDEAMQAETDMADILINCTPIGMAPREEGLPVPETLTFDRKLIVAEAVYNPQETRLLKKAVASGCRTVCGMQMLTEQARIAAGLYLGQDN